MEGPRGRKRRVTHEIRVQHLSKRVVRLATVARAGRRVSAHATGPPVAAGISPHDAEARDAAPRRVVKCASSYDAEQPDIAQKKQKARL